VASSWRSHGDEAEDGQVNAMDYIGPCYPYFVVFTILCPRGTLVFQSFVWAYK
jgi:hypothetical protein